MVWLPFPICTQIGTSKLLEKNLGPFVQIGNHKTEIFWTNFSKINFFERRFYLKNGNLRKADLCVGFKARFGFFV